MAGEKKAIEIQHSDARPLVSFFLGFHIMTTENVFFMFAYDTKEKDNQNTQQSD
jgi:hypothetical protein